MNHIQRGDIFYADLPKGYGSEQGGHRPVLIIQNNIGNRYSPTTLIAPLTTRAAKKQLPTHVYITAKDYGLERDSIALLEQVRVIDKSRLDGFIIRLDEEKLYEVDYALAVSVGLENVLAVC